MNFFKLLIGGLALLAACNGSPNANELHEGDYWISYPKQVPQSEAQNLLNYLKTEKITLTKFQLYHHADTVVVRVYGSPSIGKKNRKNSEYAYQLLANDLSKRCFQKKAVRLLLADKMNPSANQLSLLSNQEAGYSEIKDSLQPPK